ncbi:polyprenyl synthetase family protein [Ktedonosporobacter rubrisoli]|uniref:Polyprenyl synthetase family protein n=1 Tax=Ktedonosporobacter rubrisoli TaxID=2509675 RepID=A0A4V0YYU2_KTERU|nr:polyprenyl synthetase family protein [Ktedonosporobacter rubrisoli]QBD77411.1 polyprenyl synthetase family protein [Ktedonosporobacter rubrisoli]
MLDTTRAVFQRYQQEILQELHRAFRTKQALLAEGINYDDLLMLEGQMQYHLGWVDQELRPAKGYSGKLLRPILLLLGYELACTQEQPASQNTLPLSLRPALPAAAAIELMHNFTLLHDDIQDGDIERRHRPTVWFVWGVPQAILVGDALLAITRLHLWKVLDEGVEPATALRLAKLFDTALLHLTEGQHLDMSFERQQQVSLSNYEEMISRKTAALMACATEMGATLGTHNTEIIEGLACFGHALGLAFQVRDDMLGIWATEAELGKLPVGDIYRRKKSLPILHAFQQACSEDQSIMTNIYNQEAPITEEQAQEILAIFARTQTKEYCAQVLAWQCQQARSALSQVVSLPSAHTTRAQADLEALIDFVEGR